MFKVLGSVILRPFACFRVRFRHIPGGRRLGEDAHRTRDAAKAARPNVAVMGKHLRIFRNFA